MGVKSPGRSTTTYVILCCGIAALLLVTVNQIMLRSDAEVDGTSHLLSMRRNMDDLDTRWQQDYNASEPIQWRDIFSFVPHGAPHCEELFGDSAIEEKYPIKLRNQLAMFERHLLYVLQQLGVSVDSLEGYTANYHTEYLTLWELSKRSNTFVRNICETGFNAGHSSLLWLLGNKNAQVFSFDDGFHNYSKPMAQYFEKTFPGRFNIIWGQSSRTLPEFHQRYPKFRCDFIFIDAGHSMMQTYSDWINFRGIAHPNAIIILDNYPDKRYLNIGRFWEDAKQDGDLIEIFRCHYSKLPQGFVFGRLNLRS